MSVTWYCSAILGAINALVDTSLFPEVNLAGKSDLYWKVIELFFMPSDLSIFPTALIASARKSPDITSCTSVCVVVTFHIFSGLMDDKRLKSVLFYGLTGIMPSILILLVFYNDLPLCSVKRDFVSSFVKT